MSRFPGDRFRRQRSGRRGWMPLAAALLTVCGGAGLVALRAVLGRDVAFATPWPVAVRIELYWVFVVAAAVASYTLVRRIDSAVHREREALRRANRTHTLLSRISAAVLRIQDERELLSEMCRAATENGGYTAAWIGLIDDSAGSVRPVASRGCGESELPAGPAPENTPLKRVVESGSAVVSADIRREWGANAWSSVLDSRWAKACALFPLKVRERVVGVLALCSAESDVFDTNELRVLEEVVLTTSVAISYLRAEGELHRRLSYDRVTGFARRTVFIDRLQVVMTRAAARHKLVAVLLFEITNLRTLIDAFGWQAGDEAIRALGNHLASRIRAGDTIGNVGDGRLAVGLVDIAREEHTVRVLKKITDGLKLRIKSGTRNAPVHVATSVAVYPRDGETAEGLLRNAEDALKDGTRHPELASVYYARGVDRHEEKRENLGARLEMEHELSGAVARRELELVYQPIIRLPGHEVVGAESLLRWNNRRLGRVPPGAFIPVAESSALIEGIGSWVVRSVIETAAGENHSAGYAPAFTANISADQLLGAEFATRVEQCMRHAGLTAERNSVGLEVTERVLLDDFSRAVDVLNTLRELGFTIYLDDFGTGYSSLSYLHRLPVDIVKIDRSFLAQLEGDDRTRSLLEAIVGMSHALGMKVVAEGVESKEVLQIATDMGCDMAQGFGIARPDSLDRVRFGEEGVRRSSPTEAVAGALR